ETPHFSKKRRPLGCSRAESTRYLHISESHRRKDSAGPLRFWPVVRRREAHGSSRSRVSSCNHARPGIRTSAQKARSCPAWHPLVDLRSTTRSARPSETQGKVDLQGREGQNR